MVPTTMSPYLFFGGRCEEAIEFYRSSLGAEVEMMMRFNESPDSLPDGMLQPGFEDKIMHATIKIRGHRVMMSDSCDDKPKFDGFRIAFSLPNEEVAHQVFNALAEGGRVDMPLGKTFWSPCYGMVTDKFHLAWMVTVTDESAL